MTLLGPVVARVSLPVTRERVWQFVAVPELRQLWWPDASVQLALGGEVVESWSEGEGEESISRDARGTVDVLVPGHALGFRWCEAGDAATTGVLLTLRTGVADCQVVVTETGFAALPSAAERAAASQEAWNMLLTDLAAAVAEHADSLPERPVVAGAAVAEVAVAGSADEAAPADSEPAAAAAEADSEQSEEAGEGADEAPAAEGAEGAEEAAEVEAAEEPAAEPAADSRGEELAEQAAAEEEAAAESDSISEFEALLAAGMSEVDERERDR